MGIARLPFTPLCTTVLKYTILPFSLPMSLLHPPADIDNGVVVKCIFERDCECTSSDYHYSEQKICLLSTIVPSHLPTNIKPSSQSKYTHTIKYIQDTRNF